VDLPQRLLEANDFTIIPGYVGPAYGAPTGAARAARDTMLELEGVRLETTYSAKCLAALLDAAGRAEFRRACVMFWNTYNSRDPEVQLPPLPDFRRLPRPFHQFFTGAAVPA
jgi:hypothetical protein